MQGNRGYQFECLNQVQMLCKPQAHARQEASVPHLQLCIWMD